MLRDYAKKYYNNGKNCAVSVLMAANDAYQLGLTDNEIQMITGFGGGIGCENICGALSASIAALSKKYAGNGAFKSGEFVKAFEEKLGSILCKDLKAQNFTEEERCLKTVEAACDALEDFCKQLDGENKEELTPEEVKRVKGMGFLRHKDTDCFNARVITRNGRITAEEGAVIAEAAKQFGDGHMMMTTRLTIEVSGVHYKDIEAFQAFIGKAGLTTGGTGSKVRPIVSCKGTTCQYGLYDTYDLSEKIHKRFYEGYRSVTLPHKFKIATGGCPNNCIKPNLNDLGIFGQCVPEYDLDKCRGCKKCAVEQRCPVKAAKVVDGKLVVDTEKCNNCGLCVGKCPFGCTEKGQYGWRIYVGGRWGKQVAQGRVLGKLFTDENEVLDIIEKALLLYREQGKTGERFAQTIERLGFENVEQQLLENDLLERKNEILGLDVAGGATC